ncbi:ankyrin repeat-containing protein At5g02620-like [Malus sylvestris]|uniref:ankyrin repeat-containing protein At5g02620-like n=1 Tax=Malus sylvestris TaxID=3752 RepID=UPI0021ABBB29|nr:ankyrin repeat-containing protein At5g02620-like [Malus sylvestris]XP_050138016.1 ankyrin repeat-containing protein At5g02620-like [Malus sylvestris]XP_050138018.1 ankyrin repeat-containing protein At5g02620-like [Malus sylvestris]
MSSPQAQFVPAPAGIQMTAVNGVPAAGNVIIGTAASTPIQPRHPSRHLLENTNREAYLNLCMPLYKAAMEGNWETAKGILNINPALLTASITNGWETVLHVAAGAKNNIQIVAELVKMMDEEDLALQDIKGNTALSFAAATGTVEIAKILIGKNKLLPTIPGGQGMTPLYMAALFGQSEMAWYLYPQTFEMLDEKGRIVLFFCSIDHGLYDLAIKLLQDDRTLAMARKGDNETALHVLARKFSEFGDQSTPRMCSRLIKAFKVLPCMRVSYKINLKQTQALKLVECLWKEMLKHDDDEVMHLIREPSELVFDAAKLGNYEFLSVLIDSYPELLLEYDDNNRTIFHIAVLHRHANIFNLVHETGSIKDIIATFTDDENNNILHLAAKLAPQDQLNLVSGAALQMQRELVWFEEVEKIVQPPFIDMKNTQGKTPRELFTSEHEDLLRKGESWMKDTTNSCMLVSTLIATVVFSAAFSIPGGIDDNKGTPNFIKEEAFLIFAISDGVALFSSSTAILMFLYILTSRYAENDFLKSLPLKLMVGLTSLFVSITSMMVTFSTAFYLSCHYGLRWVPDLIFIFAFVPVALFAFLQYPLLFDMFFSTYCSSLLFQPRRDMI